MISAFDECREYIFGYSWGRDNPHKSDMETAKRWIDEGVTITLAVIVFHEQMTWMHEKFLRFGEAKDRSYLPASLKVFDENIEAAIRRSQSGGQSEFWEGEISRWRARLKGWQKNPTLWNENQWGPPPDADGNRLPKELHEAHMRHEMKQSERG